MTAITISVTLEVADPAAAEAFYAAASASATACDVRASEAPTTGFRGFTLSLVVSQPSTVDSLIGTALDAGATVLKPAKKSFWGYGGVVQAPDGDDLEGRDVVEEGHRPGHPGGRRPRAAAGRRGRQGDQAVLRRPRPEVGKSFGSKYVEFEASEPRVKLALYSRARRRQGRRCRRRGHRVAPARRSRRRRIVHRPRRVRVGAARTGSAERGEPTRRADGTAMLATPAIDEGVGRSGGRVVNDEDARMATTKGKQAPEQHAADSHDLIRVQGARENNLKDISVELPKRRLTVFTGVSGSGKSSLVFATIAAESQRMINETYSAFVQGFMPTLARPEVDFLEGLTTAIIVDQERMGANPRSTVGTATDANAMLRILFSRLGKPHIGPPTAFAFNVPTRTASGVMKTEKGGKEEKTVVRNAVYQGGMCPRCEGMGSVSDFDLTALYDDSKSLADGALTVPGYSMDGWYGRIFSGAGLPMDKPIAKFTKKELQKLLYAEPTRSRWRASTSPTRA